MAVQVTKKKAAIPLFESPLFETHCHLDYLNQGTAEEIIARSRDCNVQRVITIAVSPDNQQQVLELTEPARGIFGTQGVHPHDARLFTDDTEQQIREQALEAGIVAIGEIGLDYHYDHSDRSTQRAVFERQLQIAVDLNLPVIVHTREAEVDTAAILANSAHQLERSGIIHSFTSGIELAEQCLEMGFLLGFNGIVTFNAAQNVRDVLSETPLDRIVLETAAPFLTPAPYRGRENAPFYLPFVARKVAEVKGIDIEALLSQVWQSSNRVFNLTP